LDSSYARRKSKTGTKVNNRVQLLNKTAFDTGDFAD